MVAGTGFISYNVDNDAKFKAAMDAAYEIGNNLRVPLTLIMKDFYRSEQAIFKLQGPGLYPEFKHSDAVFRHTKTGIKKYEGTVAGGESPYQHRKLKKYGFDYPLLVATGSLAASVLSPTAPGSIAEIGANYLKLGTSIKYGVYHQSDEPRSKIPLRKFLFIGPEAAQFASSDQIGRLERWTAILGDHFLAETKKALRQ